MPTLIALYRISCHICMNNSLKEEIKACNFTAECPLWPYVFRWLLLLPQVWETRGAITTNVTLTWGATVKRPPVRFWHQRALKWHSLGCWKHRKPILKLKFMGKKNKTWNVFCFNGAEKNDRENCRQQITAGFGWQRKTGSYAFSRIPLCFFLHPIRHKYRLSNTPQQDWKCACGVQKSWV